MARSDATIQGITFVLTWETARMHSFYDRDNYFASAYGEACGGSCGDSCGDSCDSGGKKEELPCTCSDDQYHAGANTGVGFSDTCPYHNKWREERKRKGLGR